MLETIGAIVGAGIGLAVATVGIGLGLAVVVKLFDKWDLL